MTRPGWRADTPLLKVIGGYYAVSFPVYASWNRVMNDDGWSTAVVHAARFSLATGGVVILWFLRRRNANATAGSVTTGHDD